MLTQLNVALGLIAVTVSIQALFMHVGFRAFMWLERRKTEILARLPTLATVVWVLFFIMPIVCDVTLWAAFYYAEGALPGFEEAVYFSIVTFTTVGYGDIVLDVQWRQLAAFEAINGWIIFGWTTALITFALPRLFHLSKFMRQMTDTLGADDLTGDARSLPGR